MKRLIALFAFLLGATLAPAQTISTVSLTWDSCPTCTTIPYRFTGTCPPAFAVTQSWTALPTALAGVTAATDATVAAGTLYCYMYEAQQAGVSSPPSAMVQVSIPAGLAAPTNPTATVITVTITPAAAKAQ